MSDADRLSHPPPSGREARSARQRDALVQLASLFHVRDGDVGLFRTLTEVVAATLPVSRVSVWRYSSGRDVILCLDLYDHSTIAHSQPPPLPRSACPAYFEALRTEDIIVASDARHDPRTSEFTARYLSPLDISSMLDAPFRVGGDVEGVLCCEHRGPLRTWSEDEVTFVVAVAQVLSRLIEQAERTRVEVDMRLRSAALDAATDAVSIVALDGTVLWANDTFASRALDAATTGASASEGACGADALEAVFGKGTVWHGEVRRTIDGRAYIGHQTASPIRDASGRVAHAVVIERDMTLQRSLEAQLQQAQRMEAVGQLTGGIAHDFNNLLTIIGGHAQLIAEGTTAGEQARAGLREIVHATSRASTLTRQLLAFSRSQQLTPETLDLNAVLTDLSALLRRALGAEIALSFELDPAGVVARVDRAQFEQVVMNIVVNAREAMPRGGALRIRTEVLEAARVAEVRTEWPEAPAADLVRVTLRDTGSGMPDEVRRRVFEPFFSTQSRDRGTGLGLSTAYGIVAQSGGHIAVESEVGIGSTFAVYLPRQSASPVREVPSVGRATPSGHETILVVEDEPAVRSLTVGLLRAAGYRVLQAGSPREARQVAADAGGDVDLLLTDVVLPGETGPALAACLSSRQPHLRVLFMSGYPRDRGVTEVPLSTAGGFLPKPFTRESLLTAVRDALSSAREHSAPTS